MDKEDILTRPKVGDMVMDMENYGMIIEQLGSKFVVEWYGKMRYTYRYDVSTVRLMRQDFLYYKKHGRHPLAL